MSIISKTIVLDVDGTLTHPNVDEISERVKQSLQQEIQSGNEVVIATGRPFSQTIQLAENIGANPITLLTCNGGLIIEYPKRKIVGYNPMEKSLCLPILEFIVKERIEGYITVAKKERIANGETDFNVRIHEYISSISSTLSFNSNSDFNCQKDIIPKKELFDDCEYFLKPIQIEKLVDIESYDILEIHMYPKTQEITNELISKLKQFECERIEVKQAGTYIIDIIDPTVNKGNVLKEMHFNGLLVYMGDSENDITGMKWAIENNGFGIAMGNALDNVKSIANYITTSLEEDGVAVALQYINSLQQK